MNIIRSINNIDWDRNEYLLQSMLICRETSGGFTLKDINTLSFNEFNIILKEADRLQKPKKEENNG